MAETRDVLQVVESADYLAVSKGEHLVEHLVVRKVA